MAVVTSGTGQESTGGFGKVTGFLKVKDVLINPTKEELVDYGVNWREPNYFYEDPNRGKAAVVEAFFKVDESNFNKDSNAPKNIIMSTGFYMFPVIKTSQSGKTQFINKYGSFVYADDVDSLPSFFNREGVRPAYEGEEQLMTFLRAWGDVRNKDEFCLDTIAEICKGNIDELKALQERYKTYKLKVLVGLQDRGEGKFNHVVYGKAFWRVYSTKIRVKVDGEWTDLPYQDALPVLLDEEYNDFKKADLLTFIPKVWTADELESRSVSPDPETPSTNKGSEAPANNYSPF